MEDILKFIGFVAAFGLVGVAMWQPSRGEIRGRRPMERSADERSEKKKRRPSPNKSRS
jgi:hypothetical protein